ncbi:AAA family ATPase [Pseudorhodoplanes sp.]|uniref:AAA family ATPase n=1 Tax=Pseudorhodoplanes sp. TaxID=1934341 RepID=UPI003D144E49
MSLESLTDPAAVHAAMDEYDSLGGDAFLRKYGFGKARAFHVVRNGKPYPSKAIAGVAVGVQHPSRGTLRSTDFSGGESTVRAKLESLGFEMHVSESAAQAGKTNLSSTETYWFLGASFGRTEDQSERFVSEGIWEISTPSASEAAQVRSMKPGDRVALKAAFVQKHNLPFVNRGRTVSVMRIKARGTITENTGDGERLKVAWDAGFQPKDWYFYTYRPTIWEVHPGHELADKLIEFAFFDEPQDFDFFLAYGEWASMYGDPGTSSVQRYWIEKTLVRGRPDRLDGPDGVGQALWSPQTSKDGKNIYANMLEVKPGDVVFHLTDNDSISSVSIAASEADASFVGVQGTEWAGQPAYRIALKDHEPLEPRLPRDAFLETEPFASELIELYESGVKGLFYNKRGLNQGAYLTEATPTLIAILNRAYAEFSGKSLPHVATEDTPPVEESTNTFSLEDALATLFLERAAAEDLLLLWQARKNVILQGPPGVGKSYAAQLLAFALMGAEDRSRLGFVQFHQSYSYEDFVEGYRPTETGFELRSGKFVEFCRRAEADPNRTYVFIIDEINRGNLSKILGELMLLVESDKRDSRWAMPLASGRTKFFVPPNVYILGLMNTADRSLAVVDYALRRRFAFVDLVPSLSSPRFREHLQSIGVDALVIDRVVQRFSELNAEICADTANLGPGFAIGHSYFCSKPAPGESSEAWYARIVRTEIVPLLREYWFDAPQRAEAWQGQLLAAS